VDKPELHLLMALAEGGEEVVIHCGNDHDALHTQAVCENEISQAIVERRDGYLRLKQGGSLTFRSIKESLTQQQMLQESITKALGGGCVLVTALTYRDAEDLKSIARSAIPNSMVRDEFVDRVTLRKGGEIRFCAVGDSELRRLGFTGEVYLIQEGGTAWDRGVVPYVKPPRVRSRFERIDDE